ncbi:MAG: hypothetical protein MMC23_010013 [Stictis urceolatum]|nr:hypothetical protein [Stictis urceolata]
MSTSDVGDLAKKHRAEERELQGRITQKKKNATKRTRKGINDECDALEKHMKERHAAELATLTGVSENAGLVREIEGAESNIAMQDSGDSGMSETIEHVSTPARDARGLSDTASSNAKKPSRQKARIARRIADQAAAVKQADQEAGSIPDRRAEEQIIMSKEIKSRGLEEMEARSDGHCLYTAIADQINQRNSHNSEQGSLTYKDVRRDAARYIEDHPNEFEAFLEEPLGEYIAKVRDTGEWGGQLELSALAKAYGVVINVLQGNARVETVGPDDQNSSGEIWLAYYRHSFGLGEHYNSLRVKT